MNMKRMRGRNHRPGGGGGGGGGQPVRSQGGGIPLNRNHVFDSSGPDVRIRGTAQQLFEKYLQLGRDATSSGDRVMAESYFQHAEHYFRILNAMAQAVQQGQPQQGQPQHQQSHQRSPRGHDGNGAYNGPEPSAALEQELEEAQVIPPARSHGVEVHGMGEQPVPEAREIPIANAPPED